MGEGSGFSLLRCRLGKLYRKLRTMLNTNLHFTSLSQSILFRLGSGGWGKLTELNTVWVKAVVEWNCRDCDIITGIF